MSNCMLDQFDIFHRLSSPRCHQHAIIAFNFHLLSSIDVDAWNFTSIWIVPPTKVWRWSISKNDDESHIFQRSSLISTKCWTFSPFGQHFNIISTIKLYNLLYGVYREKTMLGSHDGHHLLHNVFFWLDCVRWPP